MKVLRTTAEALAFLESLSPSVIKLGLDRVHAALRALHQPERDFPAVHVAGTNGKGSTCAVAASCLASEGYRVGLYTSPHLLRFNERIRIDGKEIDDEVLGRRILELAEQYPALLEEPCPLTYFEVGTLIAFWHFARERVDVAVIETGLGGRLDATSACRPAVCAITQVGLDHREQLGETVREIAREKAGIIKASVPVVSARQSDEVLAELADAAHASGAPLRLEGRDFAMEPDPGGSFSYRGMRTKVPRLRLGLRGAHQVQNAAVAFACLELLEDRGLVIGQNAARVGLAQVRWPGRLEELPGSPTVVLDGAHNPSGVDALVRALDELYRGRDVHLVFSVMADKDWQAMGRALFPRCASVHLPPMGGARALRPERVLGLAEPLCPRVRLHETVAEALDAASASASDGGIVLCAGSLQLLGQVKAIVSVSSRMQV